MCGVQGEFFLKVISLNYSIGLFGATTMSHDEVP